ncbi:MAG: methylenetetrahydrofolate reductase [Candidatus Marinimicrobia bacterium]|nr:methylenetetrahydrofolate reductase [Candidatus Neomarinimicrobiota bacterium]
MKAPDATVCDLLAQTRHPLLSLEFFPPRDHLGFGVLGSSIERMRSIRPDFVTVTYGAGGTTRELTLDVCRLLRRMGFGPIMAHLTCVGHTRAELETLAACYTAEGLRNVMALRGDPPQGATRFQPTPAGLAHAGELVALLRECLPDTCLGVAGYPEGHPEAPSPAADIAHLKRKLDAGAQFVTTQVFYDNQVYFDFVARCRAAGITQPILPGLLPPFSLPQVERMLQLTRASFPAALREAMTAAGGTGPWAEAVGVHWTVQQIDELLARGAPGIHLYILNRARTLQAPELEDCWERWRA